MAEEQHQTTLRNMSTTRIRPLWCTQFCTGVVTASLGAQVRTATERLFMSSAYDQCTGGAC